MTVEEIAKVCHEANRAYCQALADNSQPTWEDAPEWQKSSAISGVNFHLTYPEATPDLSHKRWYELKFAEGWKYGPVKRADKKEHPCMVHFRALPEDMKVMDCLFKAVVDALRTQVTPQPLR